MISHFFGAVSKIFPADRSLAANFFCEIVLTFEIPPFRVAGSFLVPIGIAGRTGVFQPLRVMLRHLPAAVGIRLAVFAAGLIAPAAGASVTVFAAGLAAIIAHQASPLVRVLLNLWEIGSRHQLWAAKTALQRRKDNRRQIQARSAGGLCCVIAA